MGERDPIFVVDDEYYFRDPHTGDHTGPYCTKADAVADLKGIVRFYKSEIKEWKKADGN